MADKKPTEINEELTCASCSNYLKKPKTLPCFHTFCETCIGEHLTKTERDGTFNCPTCNAKTLAPVNGVNDLKDNFFVRNLIALLPNGPELFCDLCELDKSETPAVSLCLHCGDNLCHDCSRVHKKTRMTRDHNVILLEDARRGEHTEEVRSHHRKYCSAHPDKKIESFCDKCNILVCILCKVTDHENHTMPTVVNNDANVEDVVKNILKPVRKNLDITEKILANIVKFNGSKTAKDKNKTVDEISAVFGKLQKILISKKEELIAKIKNPPKAAGQQLGDTIHGEGIHQTLKATNRCEVKPTKTGNEAEKRQQSPKPAKRLEQPKKSETKVDDVKPAYNVKQRVQLIHKFSCVLEREDGARCWGIDLIRERYFITDRKNSKVKVFNKRGQFQRVLDHGQQKLKDPTDLTHDGEHNILVTDGGTKGIIMYDEDCKQINVIKNVHRGWGRLACINDVIIVVDHDGRQLTFMDMGGTKVDVIDKTTLGLKEFNPLYVTLDPTGNIVVTDVSKCAYIIDSKGSKVLHTYRPDGDKALRSPLGVCCDQWGHIIIADSPDMKPGCLHVISTTGTPLQMTLTTNDRLMSPTGVVISGHGEVAVLEHCGNVKVYKYLDV